MSRTTDASRSLPRGRHGLPREEVVRSQRERLLVAAARVCAERGYDGTTVARILAAAGVGRETFYELFEDRRACVLEAHQVLLDDLVEEVRVAYAGPGEWVERCRATIAALLDWFAADPLAGRFLLVELPAVGPEFHERFEAGFDRFVAVIDSGLDPELPEPEPLPATSLAVGAAISRVYGEVAAGRTEDLPSLRPSLTYEVLVPFLGEAAAREAACAGTARAA
ncbi:MAG TPA: TetR/AcrR family transcriptional regulator [Solirubrobacterales bacterium]|nr:TetR/AcrR family transcriptional regulator [Solirubrobacterales bacterium]